MSKIKLRTLHGQGRFSQTARGHYHPGELSGPALDPLPMRPDARAPLVGFRLVKDSL